MAREHPDYRNIIEQLNLLIPGRELLTMEDVMAITGYTSRNSVKKHFPFSGTRVTKSRLARLMCERCS